MNVMWVKGGSIRCLLGLSSLTCVTSHDVSSDVLAHPRPQVIPGDVFQGLVVPWVSGRGVVVVCVDDLSPQCFTPGNVKLLLECDDLVFLLAILVLLQ